MTFLFLFHITHRSQQSEIGNVESVVKKALHSMMSHRLISMQEAVHEIMTYDLVFTSDKFTRVSLAQCQKLQTQKEKEKEGKKPKSQKDVVTQYRNRDKELNGLSLEEFFYQHFCKETFDDGKENRILLAQGLNYKPSYPVDYSYARGIILLHKPWGRDNSLQQLLNDKEKTIKEFLRMIDNKEVPSNVVTQYHLAIKYSQQAKIELLAKQGLIEEPDLNAMDEDERDEYLAHQNCSNMTDRKGLNGAEMLGGIPVDIGAEYDWSTDTCDPGFRYVETDRRNYLHELKDEFYEKMKKDVTSPEELRIPLRKDGKEYDVKDLTPEQRAIVLASVDTVIKFITNDKDYKPLRATVAGGAGSGKSYVINTLTTIIRNLTMCNDTLAVAAPSGASAYNVGGCTLHRSLLIKVNDQVAKLSDENKEQLKSQLKRLLVFIIDERSMISSSLLASAESHVRQCAFGGNNPSQYWGGIPVVLIFGDDYQLFPVAADGAISAFEKSKGKSKEKETWLKKNDQLSAHYGSSLFIQNLVGDVFVLSENKRVKEEEKGFRDLLQRLRVGEPTEDDAEKLCNLHISKYDGQGFEKELESKGNVMYLSATNVVKHQKNNERLRALSLEQKVPIARMDCHYTSISDKFGVKRSHFQKGKYVQHTDICLGARVAIDAVNFIPELGLYNGAIGTVVEINYDTPEGPNNKHGCHLPDCVVVDFPHFNPLAVGLKPWDTNNPTHVPIPMYIQPCQFGCCRVQFCPLVPAWASTIHKFQGMEAGHGPDDRINYLIIDPGDINSEHRNPGMLYVSTSRAKTLGDYNETNPKNSSLYWFGHGMSRDRVLYGALKWDENNDGMRIKCKRVLQRKQWVEYLNEISIGTRAGTYSDEALDNIASTTLDQAINGKRYNASEIDNRIMTMLHQPNSAWAQVKMSKKYTVPRVFFS